MIIIKALSLNRYLLVFNKNCLHCAHLYHQVYNEVFLHEKLGNLISKLGISHLVTKTYTIFLFIFSFNYTLYKYMYIYFSSLYNNFIQYIYLSGPIYQSLRYNSFYLVIYHTTLSNIQFI